MAVNVVHNPVPCVPDMLQECSIYMYVLQHVAPWGVDQVSSAILIICRHRLTWESALDCDSPHLWTQQTSIPHLQKTSK